MKKILKGKFFDSYSFFEPSLPNFSYNVVFCWASEMMVVPECNEFAIPILNCDFWPL